MCHCFNSNNHFWLCLARSISAHQWGEFVSFRAWQLYLLQEKTSRLISYWPMKQWRVRASEQSIFVMWSTDWARWVNVCTGIHPSPQSNEFCRKGIYPGQASVFISLLPDSSGVSGALYSSALCIFHIGWLFMFYVRPLGGEQLCGCCCEFEGENSFQWEEVEQNAKHGRNSTCKQTHRGLHAAAITLP